MEIKDKIKNIMSNCEELLAEMNSKSDEVSESGLKINFDVLHNVAEKFKHSNEIISEIDAGSKYSYVKLLVFLFHKLEEKQLETALLHIEKINIAMKTGINLEKELISSYNYDEKILIKLLNDISNLSENASQMFVMDALVIISSAEINDHQILKEISAVFSKLGLEKVKIKELFDLSISYASNNYEKYLKIASENYSINLPAFYPYFKNKFQGVLSNNKNLVWIKGRMSVDLLYRICKKNIVDSHEWYSISGNKMLVEDTAIEIPHSIGFKFDNLVFKNCRIIINSHYISNLFLGCKAILFENCEIIINTSASIKFKECDKVVLKSTNFSGTGKYRCFISEDSNKITIENCSFSNFAREEKDEHSSAENGCFKISNSEEVIIDKCKFEECCTRHYKMGESNGAVGAFLHTSKLTISNSKFKNCKSSKFFPIINNWLSNQGYIFIYSGNTKPLIENNSFDNCAPFFLK